MHCREQAGGRGGHCVACRWVHTGFRDEQTPDSDPGPGTEAEEQGVSEVRARVCSQPLWTWRRPLCLGFLIYEMGMGSPSAHRLRGTGRTKRGHARGALGPARGDSRAVTCLPRESAGARPGPGPAKHELEAPRDWAAERERPPRASGPHPAPTICGKTHWLLASGMLPAANRTARVTGV